MKEMIAEAAEVPIDTTGGTRRLTETEPVQPRKEIAIPVSLRGTEGQLRVVGARISINEKSLDKTVVVGRDPERHDAVATQESLDLFGAFLTQNWTQYGPGTWYTPIARVTLIEPGINGDVVYNFDRRVFARVFKDDDGKVALIGLPISDDQIGEEALDGF